MTTETFMRWVRDLARDFGLNDDLLIMDGDQLGPNPWHHLPIHEAMQKARCLVKEYVEAGFTKIHLDASMACGGETNPTFEQIAQRATDLYAAAETYALDPDKLSYNIGIKVPSPGGETHEPDTLNVKSLDSFTNKITTHQASWKDLD